MSKTDNRPGNPNMKEAPTLPLKRHLQAAVRDIVAFVLRSGDLVHEFTGAGRTLEAVHAHQRIQQSRPDHYRAEVIVAEQIETDGFVLTVSGRIDGLFEYVPIPLVEEIKTTTRDLETLGEADQSPHWGQLKCYAAMLARDRDLAAVDLQLTYAQLDSDQQRSFQHRLTRRDLDAFFEDLVDRYLAHAAMIFQWGLRREASIERLIFPFKGYRPGQREMAVAVYRTVRDGGQALVQAATGIGKTIAALFPAVKGLPLAPAGKIFYLTARTTGRLAAEKALDELRAKGLLLKSLTLTAKEKICLQADLQCTPEDCEYARGHYDRVNAAVEDLFDQSAFTRKSIEDAARSHRVCPFELSLEMALLADCIICDYNYVFDPRVHLRRFFSEDTGPHLFLIDEAHNLVDRSREMFSAELSKQVFLDVRREIKTHLPHISRQVDRINRWMLKARKQADAAAHAFSEAAPPDGLYPALRQFLRHTDRWLAMNLKAPFRQALLDLYFEAAAFMRIAELYGENFATCYSSAGRELKVKLFCIDPSRHLSEALQRSRAAVFFSATLTPFSYFRDLLGCASGAHQLDVPSPFPPENFEIYVAAGISTLYRNRKKTKTAVAGLLHAFVERAPGNYLIFFPSYEYMTMVHDIFSASANAVDTICQSPEMTEEEREAFLARFDSGNRNTLAGFAVMGGIFGEGIDLVGERLSGAAIVGVGLPGICLERELIRNHFAGVGFEFAYTYPGINRVLQAAGRVIRSEDDRGALLLIDQRYGTRRYSTLLPQTWRPARIGGPAPFPVVRHRDPGDGAARDIDMKGKAI